MLKLLYISSFHPALEYDDLTVFNALNISWFSTGIYLDPHNPHSNNMRSTFINANNINLIDEWKALNPYTYLTPRCKQLNFTKDFIKKFDVVFISNFTDFLYNWNILKERPVIIRTYDAHTPSSEALIKSLQPHGLKLVRLFDFESRIPFSAKENAVIGIFADSTVYRDWIGDEKSVLSFNNDFAARVWMKLPNGNLRFQGYPLYLDIRKLFSCKYYGYDHTPGCPTPFALGGISWDKQVYEYQHNRVYFSLGSKPGPYTYNFIEALMTGIPTVSFGHILGDYNDPNYIGSYEVPNIIENGINGFYGDSLEELSSYIKELLENDRLAKTISINGRELALKKFDKPQVIEKWKNFFTTL